ncbi:MAG: EAL domain-containing protein [Pseudonocardia sp.]|nr:EAL domain-containing protein [Pseudonocardia sp.]
MSAPGRFAFEPLLNLTTGRPVGLEVLRRQTRDRTEHVARTSVWGPRQLAEFDSGIAGAAVLHGMDHDASVPLHVDVLADTVVGARGRVAALRTTLQRRHPDRPAPPLVLEINPALAAAPPEALLERLLELRADGFGVALDRVGRGFGLDLVAELRPDLVKIDAELVARLPTDRTASVVVMAIGDVCRAVGVCTAAVGITTTDELAAVRAHGISWAQGPLLAGTRRRASTTGVGLPADLMAGTVPAPRHSSPPAVPEVAPVGVAELVQAAVSLSATATAEQVRRALADHPQAGSVVLLDPARRPVGFLDRNRFMLAISGPFGRALWAHRPASALTEPPRTLPTRVDVGEALRFALSGDRARYYDDLVLLDEAGTCAGIVRVTDLLRQSAGGSSAA